MEISGYLDSEFSKPVSGKPYRLMINPDSIQWNRTMKSSNQKTKKAIENSTSRVDLSFDLIIDCTGIVDSLRTDLIQEIKNLENNVYSINGSDYTPNYVKITWGNNLVFFSKLKSFDTNYTLFKPDGSPLRAKISLEFGEHKPKNQLDETKKPRKSWLSNLFGKS
jgi:hypothetical protein